jgi:hypothetical protein
VSCVVVECWDWGKEAQDLMQLLRECLVVRHKKLIQSKFISLALWSSAVDVPIVKRMTTFVKAFDAKN